MREKIDGVIEAVRYTPGGQIALARLYERRGAVWSDRRVLERKELVERLQHGKRLVTGKRKPFFGSTFETGHPVRIDAGNIISEGKPAGHDHLAGIPLF